VRYAKRTCVHPHGRILLSQKKTIQQSSFQLDAVPSEQVPMAILSHKLTDAKSPEEETEILNQINK
jgi:hypothetical protein